MAIQGLKCEPSSGTGNDIVTISAGINSGRAPRTQTIIWRGIGVSEEISREVIQGGMEEFVNFGTSVCIVTSKGGEIELRGHSNSPSLTFEYETGGTLEFEIPSNYTIEGESVSNGASIPGDPGKTNHYVFSIKISIPQSDSIVASTGRILVKGTSDNIVSSCSITRDPAPGFLRVSEGTINLNYNGDPVKVEVESNVRWYVS